MAAFSFADKLCSRLYHRSPELSHAGCGQARPNEIAAALVAISFAAGLNVYATLATLGLLARMGVLPCPNLCTAHELVGNRRQRGLVPGCRVFC